MIESYSLIVFLNRLSNLLFYLDQSKKQNAFLKTQYTSSRIVYIKLDI
jgi:cob(I)alamin adenosyltransferase